MHSIGFPAVARIGARLLILGSLPGQASLARREYYAQPQNAFWRIMGELAGAQRELSYEERMEKLTQRGIALWDVCAEGFRPGSLDSAIDFGSIQTNDFAAFFHAHRQIERICFNGAKAYELYRRKVLPDLTEDCRKIPYVILPSTSPANASVPFEQKLFHWREALK